MSSVRGATKCVPCPAGTVPMELPIPPLFGAASGSLEEIGCTQCPPNQFAAEDGSESCSLCPLGTLSSPDGLRCRPCPSGTFRFLMFSRTCEQCPPNTSSLGIRPAGCRDSVSGCPSNTFEDESGECRACLPGERFDSESKTCVKCGPGEVSSGGATMRCRLCPPGKTPTDLSTNFGQALCQCEAGTQDFGKGFCEKCPAGTFSSSDTTGCRPCGAGFISVPGSLQCSQCAENEYTVGSSGAAACIPCPDGFLASCADFGAGCICRDPLTSCPAGARLTESGCNQVECPLVGTALVSGSCRTCPENTFISENGCTQCSPNEFSSFGAISCEPCTLRLSSGRFAGLSTFACRCPQRQGEKNGTCTDCEDDEVNIDNICLQCPPGTFPFVERFNACLGCTDMNFGSPSLSDLECPMTTRRVNSVFGGFTCECVDLD
ncbi:protein serine/threonine kinase [Gracilaria domingensis]|nr:protein serine/threonine kinase [Gracilaria domingensis]